MRDLCKSQAIIFWILGAATIALGLLDDDKVLSSCGVIVSGLGTVLWRLRK